MRALLLAVAFMAGCKPESPQRDPASLPPYAPAVVLLGTLTGDFVDVSDTVQGTLWEDLDDPVDERDAFRYRVVDGDGEVMWEHTTNGPVLVREFLGFYSSQTGTDILKALPKLGTFGFKVPLLEGADHVDMQLRDGAGEYQDAGSYDLSRIEDDDLGPPPSVVGHEILRDAGPSENRIDIALIGDGYTAEQQGEWQADAASYANALLDTEPFKSYEDYINVHRIDAISAESGASMDCVDDECKMRDTAFGTVFPIEIVNRLSGSTYNARAVFQLEQWEVFRAASVVPFDAVLVISNTDRYGGMAIHVATVTTPPDVRHQDPWEDTGVHELGHILGLLGDEYVGDACIRSDALGLPRNITDDPEDPPWAGWIERDTPLPTPGTSEWKDAVGAFEGGYNCPELYRPQRDCKMRNSAVDEFCSVCTEMIVRRLFRFADPEDGVDFDGDSLTVRSVRSGIPVEVAVEGEVETGVTGEPIRIPPGADISVRVAMPAPEVLEDPWSDLVSTTRYLR
jgi:hypothetical protein